MPIKATLHLNIHNHLILKRSDHLVFVSSIPYDVVLNGRELDAKGIGFSDSFGKQLGNGKDIQFWEDRWRIELLFKKWVWKWEWCREPRCWEIGELDELLREITRFIHKEGEKDREIWRLDSQEGFTVKKIKEFNRDNEGLDGRKFCSNSVVKFRFEKNVHVDSQPAQSWTKWESDSCLCPRCGEEVKTVKHALVTCNDKGIRRWELWYELWYGGAHLHFVGGTGSGGYPTINGSTKMRTGTGLDQFRILGTRDEWKADVALMWQLKPLGCSGSTVDGLSRFITLPSSPQIIDMYIIMCI
ncbi:LOW QUALITY PROTEIN: hypothetical protein OSB04_012063 [Centaurea solstitialis]|uniref:Reverse transcriptase zinc-binding domain-containing protein n=1 Tax=Centaurea solstitialis TaxID=347529 RepID=A0AA38WPQ1_9ASTR|nr:LOW QUALITY PROTEIN: hypothetical protein OSB04_012063 [Centaurea solstitialis]